MPFFRLVSICLNIGLKLGFLADWLSSSTSTTFSPSLLANCSHSAIWSGMERICLDSSTVDLRAYKTYLSLVKSITFSSSIIHLHYNCLLLYQKLWYSGIVRHNRIWTKKNNYSMFNKPRNCLE